MTPFPETTPPLQQLRTMTQLSRWRNQAIVTLKSRRYAFELVPLCLLILWCLLGPVLPSASQQAGGQTAAGEATADTQAAIRFQDGLPPELTIPTDVDLDDQAEQLAAMAEWALEHQPKQQGGALAWVKNLFGGSNGVPSLTVDDLVQNLGDLQGQTVTVVGLYTAQADGGDKLYAGSGELAISLGGGVKPRGFGDIPLTGVPASVTGLAEGAGDMPQPGIHATKLEPSGWLALLRLARINEMQGDYEAAVDNYDTAGNAAQVSKSQWSGFALERAARLTIAQLDDTARAKKLYNHIWSQFGTLGKNGENGYVTWEPVDAVDGATGRWEQRPLRAVIGPVLDDLNSDSFWYRVVGFFVKVAMGNLALGVILMALVVRLMILPLTRKQLESARAMQDLQPQIKALQAKHVDDKKKFQEEFWKLCQAHGVNPLGGCLPMLVQFPILIMLYRGIQAYIWQFDGARFLWVDNLAGPDMILLVAYTISMIFFQKLTQKMQPAAAMNPQQAQQQQMMTYMMPVMFFFFFQTFPAAFILYWLASNVIYFGEQHLYNTQTRTAGDQPTPPVKQHSGGFVAGMVNMLGGKNEQEGPNGGDGRAARKSYAEVKAENSGKKSRKPLKTGSRSKKS
jgi:YidC/Oxa1 family membrane protein insertase